MGDDVHSISRTSSGTRLEIDSGTGMSIGLNNEGLSLSDDQLHKPQWQKALNNNNPMQLKNSEVCSSEATWSWKSEAGSVLERAVERVKGKYGWLPQQTSEYKTIELCKGPGGELGIRLEGGLDKPAITGDPGIFVKSVLKRGPAEGKLTPGDRIISVDDVDISSVCRAVAAVVIREANDPIKLYVKTATYRQQIIHDSSRRAMAFTPEQLDEFEDAFCVFDRRGNGFIKMKDVHKAMRSLGYNPSEAELWVYMNELGITADKFVLFQDFIRLIDIVIKEQNTERDVHQAFSMFDENDKGFIEYADLEEALGKMPGAGAVKRKELCDMLSLSDPANTGKIKIKGFKKLVLPTIKQY